MINDPKLLSLLEQVIEGKLPGFEPVFAPRADSWVSYPAVEGYLGVDATYACRLLEDLVHLGYLTRTFSARLLFCPACNSHNLAWTIVCPKCNSTSIQRTRFLRHRLCNWSGPEKDFLRPGGERICPKCRNELLLLGNDYDDLGYRYICPDCREVTRAPVEFWRCPACNRMFDKYAVRELVLYKYVIEPSQVPKLRLEKIPRAKVRELLQREGYAVQESVRIPGKSGAEHIVDMLATKMQGPLEHRVLVSFACGNPLVDAEEVIRLYARAYDVGVGDVILIATPGVTADAAEIAQHYQIRVYNADELDKIRVDVGPKV